MASTFPSDPELSARVSAFKATISSNLLARDDFIDWDTIRGRLQSRRAEMARLQALVDRGLTRDSLSEELRDHPGIYPLLLDLLAFNSTGAQVEKWGFVQHLTGEAGQIEWVVDQLFYVGLPYLLAPDVKVDALLQVAEVYKDTNRRRFRAGRKLDTQVWSLVTKALQAVKEQTGETIRLDNTTITDPSLRRAFSYVFAKGNRPVAALATVFQNQSGGRQLRDLSVTYPNYQQRLSEHGVALVLLADGQGLREASDRVLHALFYGVRFPLNLEQASSGGLEAAILEAATGDAPETFDQAALNRLIEDGLRRDLSVKAAELPVSSDQARLALAAFANTRRRANLTLSASGEQIQWVHRDWISQARDLRRNFVPADAVDLFARMLEVDVASTRTEHDQYSAELQAPPVQPFAENLHVTASPAQLTTEIARDVGRRAMEHAPQSSVAMYLTANGISNEQLGAHRKQQIFYPSNIVVIGAQSLEQMASDKRPLDRLLSAILSQSDLTKVSPFILSNPTTPRMFYGRESEAATVQRTLANSSVAILGSRRIGKTSLIRRLREELSSSNFLPFFGDCQTVRTWNDFADLARRSWKVDLPVEFRPAHLESLIQQLQARGEGQVVLILDEIDQLIEWDQSHAEDVVPEAFFRSCRLISQSGAAQFVFSGERRIANRLWDPQSPHWNFCRALQLRQLDRPDATSLLLDPLRSMSIRLNDPEKIADLAWERTSGHPQIVQFLGDRLVRVLNERSDRSELAISSNDVIQVTETTDFAQHYLTTYWGQAQRLEKAISEVLASVEVTPAQLVAALPQHGVVAQNDDVLAAIRMLQLYGIIEDAGDTLSLRAKWFRNALSHFGSLVED